MSRRTDPIAHLPFPEVVDPRARTKTYTIYDTSGGGFPVRGMIDIAGGELYTLLTDRGVSVTRHEQGHARWSPMRFPKVDFDRRILLAVEDARVNSGLARLGLPVHLSVGERGNITHLAEEDLDDGRTVMFLVRAIASIGTNGIDAVLAGAEDDPAARALAEELIGLVDAGLEKSRRRRKDQVVATASSTVRAATAVAARLRVEGVCVDPTDAPFQKGCCLGHACGELDDAAMMRREFARRRGRVTGVKSGRMRVVEAPLTIPRTMRRAAPVRERRASAEGAVMHYPGRWVSDRSIFLKIVSRSRSSGSVLIDTSGSMSLSPQDVDAILDAAQSSVLVAIYSGSDTEGEVRVVARGGARAPEAHLKPYGKGNIIDAPALEWLGAQPAPRIWVSDGRVTGVGDTGSGALRRKCRALCRRFAITRVESAEEAAARLRA